MFQEWLQERLGEATSWLGIAAFFASTGTALAGAGFPRADRRRHRRRLRRVGAFITKEKGAS